MKSNRIQVGVDISKHKLDLCMLTSEGQVVLRHRSFPNSAGGYRQLRETLLNAVQAGDYRGIDVGGSPPATTGCRSFCQRKYQEVNKHPHKRALVLTACKSVGLFVGLLHRKEPYRSPEGRRA